MAKKETSLEMCGCWLSLKKDGNRYYCMSCGREYAKTSKGNFVQTKRPTDTH